MSDFKLLDRTELTGLLDNVNFEDPKVIGSLGEVAFSLDRRVEIDGVQYNNFNAFRNRPENITETGSEMGVVEAFINTKNDDLKSYFNSQNVGRYDDYVNFAENKDFNMELLKDESLFPNQGKNVINVEKRRAAELYIRGLDLSDEEQENALVNIQSGAYELFDGDQDYINEFKKAIQEDKTTRTLSEDLDQNFFQTYFSRKGFQLQQLSNELKEQGLTQTTKVINKYVVESKKKLDNDVDSYNLLNSKYQKDRDILLPKITELTEKINKLAFVTEGGIVPYTQDENELKKLNGFLEQRFKLVTDFHSKHDVEAITKAYNDVSSRTKKFNEKVDLVGDYRIQAAALATEYGFAENVSMNALDIGMNDLAAVIPGIASNLGYKPADKLFNDIISIGESFKKHKESVYPISPKFRDLNFFGKASNVGEFATQLIAENSFSIATALTAAGGFRLATGFTIRGLTVKPIISQAAADRVSLGIATLFFGTETGSQLSSLELMERDAKIKLPAIEAEIKNTKDKNKLLDLYSLRDTYNRHLSLSGYQKAFNPLMYGSIAAVAEKLGTLSIMKRLGSFTGFPELTFKSAMRGVGMYGKNIGIEYVEEAVTEIGHNISDYVVLKDTDISFIKGIDADFNMNVLFSTMVIQGPSMSRNVLNAFGNEFKTRAEFNQHEKIKQEVIITLEKIKKVEFLEQKLVLENRLQDLLERSRVLEANAFLDMADLTRENIDEIFENSRIIRKNNERAGRLGGRTGINQFQDPAVQEELKEIIDENTNLMSRNEELRNKPLEERQRNYNKIVGKAENDTQNAFFVNQYHRFKNTIVGAGIKSGEYVTFDDALVRLNELVNNGTITVEKYDKLVAGLETKKDDNGNIISIGANGTFIRENNEVILIDENVYNNIANSKSRVDKSAMAYSPIHEAGHMYDNDVGISKDGEVQEKHKKAVEETVKFLEDLDQDSEAYKFAKKRITQYTKDGKFDLNELKEIIGEMKNAGLLKESDTNILFYFRDLFNKIKQLSPFGKNTEYIQLKTAADVLAYVDSFQKKIEAQKVVMQRPPEEEVKVTDAVFSKGVVDQINDLVPNDIKTRDQFAEFFNDPRRNKEIGKALQPGGIIYNQVMAKAAPDAREKVLDQVRDRVMLYNPAAERKTDSDTPVTFAERIFSDIRFGKMEAAKELATKPKTTTIDQPTETGSRTFDIADEIQEQEELTPQQLESEIKKTLKLTDEVIEKVKQAVRKTYGTKLPDIRSKQYRTQLKDALIVELKKEIQDLFGREQEYNKFLQRYIPALHRVLNADRWVQIERRVPKDKKIFVQSRRITSVKEVRKLQQEGKIRKDVKPASGPNLNTKLKTPSKEQIMAFFRGKYKNPETREVKTMQDILGYTIKESAFGPRKDALAEAVVEKVGFDAAVNILNAELDVVERMRDVQDITNVEQIENDVQVIADILDVNPDIALSLGAEITAGDVVNQFGQLLLMAQKNFDNFAKNRHTLKYKGKPYLEAIVDPIYELGRKSGFKTEAQINKALKSIFGLIPKKKGENTLGDIGERAVRDLFVKAGLLAPGHEIGEFDVYIKPIPGVFEGGIFQNSDIVFELKNGQQISMEIKFAVDGTVNAGKISIKSYDSKGNFEFSDTNIEQSIQDKVTKLIKPVLTKTVKKLEKLIVEKGGYPKGTKLDDIVLPEVSPYNGYRFYTKFPGRKRNLWNEDIASIKAESNVSIEDDGSVSIYLYNKKGNYYLTSIREGQGAGVYYLGQDILQTEQSLGITSIKGEHNVKANFLVGSSKTNATEADVKAGLTPNGSIYKNGKDGDKNKIFRGYKFRINVEAQLNTKKIAKTSGFIIRGDKDVQRFKKAINDSALASFSLGPKTFGKAVIQSRSVKRASFSKGITILDFDDTLATTKSLVKFTDPNGNTGTLNAEQYASTYQDLLEQGYTFDFTDFNKVVGGKIAPLFQKALKLQNKFGPKNMFVLTARPAISAGAIFDFLTANGLNIPIENITGLGNSTAEAKALWVADKAAQGYNDFYFADDALQNVQAVKNMLDQFDVKSKVQQAKVSFSEGVSLEFNKILEEVTGIGAQKTFSEVKARKRGKYKGRFRFFIPPSHEDLVGLLYNFMGKGKRGDAHREFFEKTLIRPLNRAFREYDVARQSIASDFKSLKKKFPNVKEMLTKQIPDSDFTYEDAIRVYLWDKHGHAIPGISQKDQVDLVKVVKNNSELLTFASGLNVISKRDDYVAPVVGWEAFNIKMDLIDATDRVGREEFFEEFFENADMVFSKENLNKIEASYGSSVRNAIEDILYRIKTGRNRPKGKNAIVNALTNFVNAAVGTVMFFNIRSLTLQQMSIVNFINFADNNIFQAAKAFANQSQYWDDWSMLFNSAFMKQRRGGIRTDVNGAELATEISKSQYPIRSLIRQLLQLGFKPTQIGDNIAIATGGALFYRNRLNTYLKQGLDQVEAERRAFADFQVLAEATQQSARPDMVSQQQASDAGKWILAFQNVTSQFNRLGKKAFLDIKNRRITPPNTTLLQSDISNSSRILYYFAVQNLIFYGLQSALFFMMFDDNEDDEKFLKKRERMISGSIDSVLRGSGVMGAAVATLKNMAIKFLEQREASGYSKDESAVIMELANFSPPVGIKLRKLVNAEKTLNYNENIISEMESFDSDNPQWSAVTNYIEALTNVPANRLYNKTQNLRQVLDSQNEAWKRALMFLGWSQYNLGIQNEAVEEYRQLIKNRKALSKPKKGGSGKKGVKSKKGI